MTGDSAAAAPISDPYDANASVADQAPWYIEQVPEWELAKTLLGGTKAMREAGEQHLPRFTIESSDAYARRLKVATLTNFYSRMARKMVGLMFATPLKVEKSQLDKAILDDIDKRGNSVDMFARKLALQFLTRGLHHIFVDHPPRPKTATTLGDDKELGLRPYWISMPAETLFSAYAERDAGAEKLLQARWFDNASKLDGFDIATVERVRVVQRDKATNKVTWALYEKKITDVGEKQSERWVKVDFGDMTIDRIPLVTTYTERVGFMLSNPPLADVAYKNVQHWQCSSDYNNIVTLSCFPTQTQIGTINQVNVTGPGSVLHSQGNPKEHQPVEFGYIEPDGMGIEAGDKRLARILEEAEALGVELLLKRPSNSATEASIDFASETSPLQDIAQAVEDAITGALELTALWLGKDAKAGGYAVMNRDFGITADDEKALTALREARKGGDLSRETLWGEYSARGVFKAEFNPEEEAKRLEKEDESLMDQLRTQPPVPPGGPHPQPQPGGPKPAGGDNPDDLDE